MGPLGKISTGERRDHAQRNGAGGKRTASQKHSYRDREEVKGPTNVSGRKKKDEGCRGREWGGDGFNLVLGGSPIVEGVGGELQCRKKGEDKWRRKRSE